MNAWVINRNKTVFGADADHFRPERWLEKEDPDSLKQMDQCFATFGFGSRVCLGRNLALMEINKVNKPSLSDFNVEVEIR